MSEPNKIRKKILGYVNMLEKGILSEFKRIYPDVVLEERTERPTIDVSDYKEKPGKALNPDSEGFSFFRAEPGFRADPGFKPRISGKKPMPYIDIDGKIRYKYE